MKTKLSGKGFLSIVLVLLMLLSLVPMSALAATYDGDGKVTSTSFELGNYGYGKPVNQYWVSGEKDGAMYIADILEDNCGIFECTSETFDVSSMVETTDMYFAANKQYYFMLRFHEGRDNEAGFADSFTFKDNTTLTVNGTQCEAVYGEATPGRGAFWGYFKLPVLDAVPMAIPFTKTVEQGGNVAPGTGSFELEVKNLYVGSNRPIDNYTIDGLSFTTDGSGTSDKQFTISNDNFAAVLQLLDEGILVSEKQSGNAGWQYDDTVWCVKLHHDPVVNGLDDVTPTMQGYSFDFFKGEMVDGEFVPDSQTPTDKMTFTNTYTEDIEDVVTVKIPFVKKVTLGGDVAPTGGTFKFEIFNIGNGNADGYADVTYTAEVTVNGKGEFEGELIITGPEGQVDQMICEGFYVREIDGKAQNWKYSEDVWHIVPESVPVEDDGISFVPNLPAGAENQGQTEPEMMDILSIYPTTKIVEGENVYYEDAAETAQKMIFENIYTENKPAEPTSNKPAEPTSPQTGDNSMMGLWIALLFISGFGVVAATVISKKRSVR